MRNMHYLQAVENDRINQAYFTEVKRVQATYLESRVVQSKNTVIGGPLKQSLRACVKACDHRKSEIKGSGR